MGMIGDPIGLESELKAGDVVYYDGKNNCDFPEGEYEIIIDDDGCATVSARNGIVWSLRKGPGAPWWIPSEKDVAGFHHVVDITQETLEEVWDG